MKITTGDDWRSQLVYDVPVLVADVLPGDPARCGACPYDAAPHPRTDLWAVKQRNPKNHNGEVRFFCAVHVPEKKPEPAPEPLKRASARSAAPRARSAAPAAPRRTPVAERPRPVCPDCFVEVPPTGVCGMCGERIA